MTSITELAERIKIDNSILIHGQEDANKSLESIDRNFTRFFSIQERNRLDNLESKLDANRKRPVRAGRGFAATAAAVANPFNWLKALTPGNILKGVLAATGALLIKPALKGLGLAARGLQNQLDAAAKTQRGLNNFTAEDLRVKEKAKATAAKLEEQRLKAEQKALEKQRKQAIIDENARVRQAKLAEESFKAQALEAAQRKKLTAAEEARVKQAKVAQDNFKATAEEARVKRLELEARLDKTKASRTEAGIAKKQALQNAKILKDVKGMSKFNQEPILRNMAASLADAPIVRTGPSKLDMPVVPSQAFQAPTSVKKPFTATISNASPSASQAAAIKLVSPTMAEDLAKAGFEAVDMGNGGVRFRAVGPNNTFVAAEKVLAEVEKVKAAGVRSTTARRAVKVGGGALLAVDAALAMAAEVQRAKDEKRVLKQSEMNSAGIAGIATIPFAIGEFLVNTLTAGIEKAGASVGYTFPNSGERLNLVEPMSKDMRTDLNSLQEKLGIGQGEANKSLVKGSVAVETGVNRFFSNLIGAFTGKNKNASGVLSGYDNMTPADYQAMAIAPNIDASNTTYNSGSVSLHQNTPTRDLANGGGFDIIGGP
jgi:hypothetical protein